MKESVDQFVATISASPQEAMALIGRLFDVARPNAVYTDPIVAGDNTVITASELVVTMGAGFGVGAGYGSDDDEAPEAQPGMASNGSDETIAEDDGDGEAGFGGGAGGGGGGGGISFARPVAAIIVDDDGVWVEPIIDPTKIAIAFLTTTAAMVITLLQLIRFTRSQRL